jgi:hypothetical protein
MLSFTTISSVGVALFCANGQMDRLKVAFRTCFANAPKT